MTFEVQHHATMLDDRVRLHAFRDALASIVRPTDCVVDLGTGTGILASYAARMTRGPVFGVEYYSDLADVATRMTSPATMSNVNIITGNAASVVFPTEPDVLVSETIGALGPEERIVELFHLLRIRFPKLRALCPSRLELWAVPVRSASIDRIFEAIYSKYESASHNDFQYARIRDALAEHLGKQVLTTRFSEYSIVGTAELLVAYELGSTSDPAFSTSVADCWRNADAAHLYFNALLAPGIQLSSFVESPLTHWQHSFIRKPSPACRRFDVEYESRMRRFSVRWS